MLKKGQNVKGRCSDRCNLSPPNSGAVKTVDIRSLHRIKYDTSNRTMFVKEVISEKTILRISCDTTK